MAQIHSYLVANAKVELNFINDSLSTQELTHIFHQISFAMENDDNIFDQDLDFIFDNDNDLNLENQNSSTLDIGELIDLTRDLNVNSETQSVVIIDHGDRDFNIDELIN
jgi:hypothetical protein